MPIDLPAHRFPELFMHEESIDCSTANQVHYSICLTAHATCMARVLYQVCCFLQGNRPTCQKAEKQSVSVRSVSEKRRKNEKENPPRNILQSSVDKKKQACQVYMKTLRLITALPPAARLPLVLQDKLTRVSVAFKVGGWHDDLLVATCVLQVQQWDAYYDGGSTFWPKYL